jgi:phosphodiesterase/alkaline phosphatase D-like protein
MSNSHLILGPLVGGLSDRSVNLWGRADHAGTLQAWLGNQPDLADAWLAGSSAPLEAKDAYAGVVPVTGLSPEYTYYYDLRLDGAKPPVQTGYARFTTFPAAGELRDFSFVFGSCFRPAVSGGGEIFANLEARRAALDGVPEKKLRFLLQIGDQIYADDWNFNGLWQYHDGKKVGAQSLEDYRNVYRYTWSNPHYRALLENLPAFMTLDDHEVDDDWRWTDRARQTATLSTFSRFERWLKGRPASECSLSLDRVRNALKAYWEHQAMHSPPMLIPPHLDTENKYVLDRDDPGSLAYTFEYGAAAFFVLDTRTMRVRSKERNYMLGDGQWQKLKEWLLQVKDSAAVKFLVSSSAVFYGIFGDFLGDRWSGFPQEREELIRFIGENRIENVFLLAGDLHSAHYISAEVGDPDASVCVEEFCSTPFEQAGNWAARWLYWPVHSPHVHHQTRHFVTDRCNYGIVQVSYPDGAPQVEFRLYGTDGQQLGTK